MKLSLNKTLWLLVLGVALNSASSFARDHYVDFTDSAQNGFGLSRDGSSFRTDGSADILSAHNGQGSVVFHSPATRVVTVLPIRALDVEASFSLKLSKIPSTGFIDIGPVVRQDSNTSNASKYVAYISFARDRHVLRLAKVVDGRTIRLEQHFFAFPAERNEFFSIKLSAIGSNPSLIQAKVWPKAATEPTRWLVSAYDNEPKLQVENNFAGIFVQSTPEFSGRSTIRVDDLLINNVEVNESIASPNQPPAD